MLGHRQVKHGFKIPDDQVEGYVGRELNVAEARLECGREGGVSEVAGDVRNADGGVGRDDVDVTGVMF